MAFNELTKGSILRPGELFKYRLKRDCSIPPKGGQKEFEPDGSWIQRKCLEAFLQERTSVLSEPRVEKLKNMVEGVWEEEKKLVNLKKPRKFWMYMGFTDDRRNWLHPEEALFLMETNTLEVYHKGRPLSIQEAYSKLLGSGMCLEEYQVFAHLRRLGYVVLRHEEERIFTDYERQINLNEYIDVKKRKEQFKKGKGKSNKKISPTSVNDEPSSASNGTTSTNSLSKECAEHHSPQDTVNGTTDQLGDSPTCSKRKSEEEIVEADGRDYKARKLNDGSRTVNQECSDSEMEEDSAFYSVSTWSSCFKTFQVCQNGESGKENGHNQHLNQTSLDSSCSDLLPDLGSPTDLKLPPANLLPTNLEVSVEEFDYTFKNLKNPSIFKFSKESEMSSGAEKKKEMTFSCLEKKKDVKIKASSWSEYKAKKIEQTQTETSSKSPVDHLWHGSVTPLMRPSEITSYRDIISKLQIIQSADNSSLEPDVSILPSLPKISFDVHLPDHRFKKSMPGIPDHRICVTRCDGIPPGLTAIQFLWSNYKDGVPVHWAVVDSGEIAFYVFDNTQALEALSPKCP